MKMVKSRAAADFERTVDFVITDPTFEFAGNTMFLVNDFRRCERC